MIKAVRKRWLKRRAAFDWDEYTGKKKPAPKERPKTDPYTGLPIESKLPESPKTAPILPAEPEPESEMEKAPTLRKIPVAPKFSPWTLMYDIARELNSHFDPHKYKSFSGRQMLQRPQTTGYNKSSREFKEIVNMITQELGRPTDHIMTAAAGHEQYKWEAFGDLSKREPGAVFFSASHDINGDIEVYCKFVDEDYR